ncbi:MAG: hypothetical protein AABY07_06895 [Nanoarchaeota archaeon]
MKMGRMQRLDELLAEVSKNGSPELIERVKRQMNRAVGGMYGLVVGSIGGAFGMEYLANSANSHGGKIK